MGGVEVVGDAQCGVGGRRVGSGARHCQRGTQGTKAQRLRGLLEGAKGLNGAVVGHCGRLGECCVHYLDSLCTAASTTNVYQVHA